MKLIISIVHRDDSDALLKALTEAGLKATLISTTGGFLREGNATVFVGAQNDKVEEVLELVKENCHQRTRYLSPIVPVTEPSEFYIPQPVELEVGGATVFVIDVERHERF
ncbi:MAG: cyclic-di-AMP receptor [Anaerolineae bacterium]|nr:cyclic-di-AMP receptor [Anaerolineae bacterium]